MAVRLNAFRPRIANGWHFPCSLHASPDQSESVWMKKQSAWSILTASSSMNNWYLTSWILTLFLLFPFLCNQNINFSLTTMEDNKNYTPTSKAKDSICTEGIFIWNSSTDAELKETSSPDVREAARCRLPFMLLDHSVLLRHVHDRS